MSEVTKLGNGFYTYKNRLFHTKDYEIIEKYGPESCCDIADEVFYSCAVGIDICDGSSIYESRYDPDLFDLFINTIKAVVTE